ncbi:uncharacterized protein LOC127277591 [Leptopilina boulardi]|uniref:uncharacterized protein LOC127277591 n=1 Tax=Leptopilina boulardi TaxID=63433 RepID=UPI0021F5FEC5|nr:uncharacterized protein LOC127277591 [Leptopilina boulardi]
MNSNTSSIFIQQSSEFQFLSVCHYITIFGLYFYNKKLITLDERSHSVPVLNTYFKYLNKATNESEAKIHLIKIALKGSDLYGGEENEILDMKYVDGTYQYIISEALFSHYGNINGYLAKIINMADNINYSVLKKTVFQHLSKNYTSREYCSNNIPFRNIDSNNIPLRNHGSKNNPLRNHGSKNNPLRNHGFKNNSLRNHGFKNNSLGNYGSKNNPLGNYGSKNIPLGNYSFKLNGLTIQKVFHNHIWPIFPQPEQDMRIIEVNYIYAMVGLKIVRSVSSTTPNITFKEYILISREIDLQHYSNENYEMVLKLFSTPALFFYAYNQRAKFQKIDFTLSDEFWIEAYENLFSHINFTVQKIVQEDIDTNLHFKLEREINTLRSRTNYAYEILRLYCNYENIAEISPIYVEIFKTFYFWLTMLLLPKRCQINKFPDLETAYEGQFLDIKRIYNTIERHAIENVLIDSKLGEVINEKTSVMLARIPDYPQRCMYCSPTPRHANNNTYLLFAVVEKNKKNDFYAFKQEKNVLALLNCTGNEREFAKAIANDSSLMMEIAIFSQTLKYHNEDYRGFIARVAEIKTKQFLDNLKKYYYDETIGEKFLNFVKSLIPFYSCIESAKAGRMAESAFGCTMDVLSLIPFVGFVAKYTARLTNSLAMEIGNKYLITNTLARAGIISELPIITVLNQIFQTAVRTIAKEILNRSLLKDLTVASLRTLDPGFEFFYHVSSFGYHAFRKLFRNFISWFKNIPTAHNTVELIKSLLKNIKQNMDLQNDQMGLVPFVLARRNGYEIVRHFYPGGSNFFGPTCLTSFGNTAELRTIEGYSFPLPVLKKSGFYEQYNPKTGDKIGKLKMNSDILQRIGNLINEMIINGRDINIIRNYHVYHNTMNWNKPNEEPTENLNAAQNEELQQNPVTTRESTVEHNFQQLTNPEFLNLFRGNPLIYNSPQLHNSEIQVTLRGNLGFLGIPPMTNIELSGTFRANLLGQNIPPTNFEQPGTSNSFATNNNLLKQNQNNIPEKRKRIEEMEQNPNNVKNLISQRLRNRHQPKLEPKFYQNILKATYSDYVNILMLWKQNGLPSLRLDGEKINFLRIAVNNLATLQLTQGLPLLIPRKLWYTQKIQGQHNIEKMRNLKGKTFFFNDIIILNNNPPGTIDWRKIDPFAEEIEIRYHLTINSPYGFVDITKFHEEFKNNYITFNDVLFTIKDIFTSSNNFVLNIQMENQGMSKDLWQLFRETESGNLLQKIERTERMKSIFNAANLIAENAPLCTFQSAEDLFSIHILNIKSNIEVPSYETFAREFNSMKYHYNYNDFKIKKHPYIQDVLLNRNLDKIINLSEARHKIHDVYNYLHGENIEIVFNNYQMFPNIEQNIRFEDYYVLFSESMNKLVANNDVIRRFEAAINRLALRQCDEKITITNPMKIYRGELMHKDLYQTFVEAFEKKDNIVFAKFKKFSSHARLEARRFLPSNIPLNQIPLLMKITIKNRAGIADVSRIFNDENLIYVVTADFEFVIDNLSFQEINNEKVLVMEMHDYEMPTEKRMVQMAKKLDELFSTETKFYSTF